MKFKILDRYVPLRMYSILKLLLAVLDFLVKIP